MKLKGLACGLSLGLALAQGPVFAEELIPVAGVKGRPTSIPACATPCPTPSAIPNPLPSTQPGERPTTVSPEASAQAPSAAPEATGAGEGAMVAAPNMIGNLLGLNRSVSFPLFTSNPFPGRASGVSYVNPKVAENNSPLPQDRIAYRYNHFNNSNTVFGVAGAANQPPVSSAFRDYDVNLHTFQFEKTFLDGMASAELRVPFQTTLSNNLNLRATSQTGFGPNYLGPTFGLQANNFRFTPQNTLGNESTQFCDLTFILKALLYCQDGMYISGGVSFGIPTGPDTNITVVDSYFRNSTATGLQGGINRIRNFQIKNETWSAGPFLAFLSTPSDRVFVQGFAQVDFPLNSTSYRFFEDEGPKDPRDEPLTVNGRPTPFVQTGNIRDQILMNLDLGTGYWLVKNNCCDAWLNGLAAIAELHYTTTLQDADIVTLPRDNVQDTIRGNVRIPPTPTIGNLRNRVDIFDVTTGVSALISNRLLLTGAVSFPFLGGDNRTYDWEAHIQANYYFGGPRYRESFAPPF